MSRSLLAVSTLMVLASSALAQAPAKPAPKPPGPVPGKQAASPPPPSTGKEMPKLGPPVQTAKELQAVIDAALAEAKKPNPNCAIVANAKTSVAWMKLPVPPKATLVANVDAYVNFARCAEKEQFYALTKDVGFFLVKAGTGRHEILARGLIGLDNMPGAIVTLKEGLKKAPKDANLLVTAAKVSCALDQWAECGKLAADALKNAEGLDAKEKLGVSSRALKYLARAALHVGALDKAQLFAQQSEKLGGDKTDLAEIRALVTQAEVHKALVEPKYDHDVPIGIYHLYGKVKAAGTLVKLQLTNLGPKDAQFKSEVSIDGVTQKAIQNATIPKGKSKWVELNPPLLASFNPSTIRAASASQITVKVTASSAAGEKVVYEQTLPIKLHPRDFLPTVQREGKDSKHSTLWTVAAWITPNAKSIDGFLQKAKARAPRATFSGEQSDTFAQVKAIYDELQAQGVSYVMDPSMLENGALHGQRTRLPSEVLTSTNAQCLEGTILYATLLEAIGLKPVVVTVPGHAFVGWHPSPKDKVKSKAPRGMMFVETTMTHDGKFEDAVNAGVGQFLEHDKKKKANVIDIAKLRGLGVSPQPLD